MRDNELSQSDFVEVYSISKSFLKKYYGVLIIFSVVVSFLNWYYYFNEYNFYETNFVISDGGVDKSFFTREELFNPVNLEELFTVNVALPDSEFQALRSDFNHVKTFSIDTTINNCLIFELSLNSKDVNLISLRNNLVAYLSENRYILRQNNKKKKTLTKLIGEIDNEIEYINNIEKSYQNIVRIKGDVEEANFIKDKIELLKLKNRSIAELDIIGSYEIVRDISVPLLAEQKLGSSIFFGGFLGLVLGIAFGVIRELDIVSRKMNRVKLKE